MAEAPREIFNRALWLQRRAQRPPTADFLHREAAAQVGERLLDVARRFERVALVWPGADCWAEELRAHPSVGAVDEAESGATEIVGLAEGAYDLAVAGLTLHWANDPVGALVQMRRILKPDGLMIAVLFGGQTLHELRASLAEAEIAKEGGVSPRVAPMGEIRDLGALLQRAGFAMPVADSERLTVTHESMLHLMRDLRAMGETNVMTDRRRSFLRRGTLMRALALHQQHFADADGRVPATFELVFLTGWAPGPEQPKPLRPGSAKMRLAEALGVEEISAGEKPGGE
jgi:SAM-dependent methyltransferase